MKIGRVIGKGNDQQGFEVKKLLSDKSVFPSLTYHLQSAQFITNAKGEQYEHIEYTPYGELWTYKSKTAMLFLTTYNNFLAKQPAGLIEETAPGIDKLPFRFTGKELDEETGLYYYGARYLDPKYSRWLSGDPALNEYIPKAPINDEAKKHNENLPGMGGVFNTVNLHVYHYAGNNPVKYIDPDGRSDKDVAKKRLYEAAAFIIKNASTKKEKIIASIIQDMMSKGKVQLDNVEDRGEAGAYVFFDPRENTRSGEPRNIIVIDIKEAAKGEFSELIDTLAHEAVHAAHNAQGHDNNTIKEEVDAWNMGLTMSNKYRKQNKINIDRVKPFTEADIERKGYREEYGRTSFDELQ